MAAEAQRRWEFGVKSGEDRGAARTLSLEPSEVRRRNMIRADEMPYRVGIPYRDGADMRVRVEDPVAVAGHHSPL